MLLNDENAWTPRLCFVLHRWLSHFSDLHVSFPPYTLISLAGLYKKILNGRRALKVYRVEEGALQFVLGSLPYPVLNMSLEKIASPSAPVEIKRHETGRLVVSGTLHLQTG